MINADVNRLDHVILPRRLPWRPQDSDGCHREEAPLRSDAQGGWNSSVVLTVPPERSPYMTKPQIRGSHMVSGGQ